MSGQRPFVIGIAGWKNSGKTTLAARLIAALSARGLRVASIKHAHHAFEIDHPDTDSARHREAGARETAIVSSRRWALMHELNDETEPSLQEILTRLSPCDVVVVEGYKGEAIDKIEVRRRASLEQRPLHPADPHVIAIAADHPVEEASIPVLDLDDIAGLAALVIRRGKLDTV